MSNFWLAKTKTEIAAIPYTQCNNGSRLWCIDTQSMFRYFQFRSFDELPNFPTVFIKPTNRPSNVSGIWQNEGDIYADLDTAFSNNGYLYSFIYFPPATTSQKVVTTYFDSSYPDEQYVIEWIPYHLMGSSEFPDFSLNGNSNNRSWKILKTRTILSNRNPVGLIIGGDGNLWYKKDENRLFFNSHKIMTDDVKNNFSIYADSTTWDELEFTETDIN